MLTSIRRASGRITALSYKCFCDGQGALYTKGPRKRRGVYLSSMFNFSEVCSWLLQQIAGARAPWRSAISHIAQTQLIAGSGIGDGE